VTLLSCLGEPLPLQLPRSGSKPNLHCSATSGAKAPNVSMQLSRSRSPAVRSQPKLEPCPTSTRAALIARRLRIGEQFNDRAGLPVKLRAGIDTHTSRTAQRRRRGAHHVARAAAAEAGSAAIVGFCQPPSGMILGSTSLGPQLAGSYS